MLLSLVFVFATFATSQVTVEGATAPDFNDGKIIIDTTGTGVNSWLIWKVEDGVRTDKSFGYNTKVNSGLSIGTYWILGQKPNDGYLYSLNTQVNVGMRSSTICDSMKLTNYDRYPVPILPGDPTPPQPGFVNMKFNYDIEKSCGPVNIEYYQKVASNGPPQSMPSYSFYNNTQYNVPIGSCFFVVVTDCNCTAIISDMRLMPSASNYPPPVFAGGGSGTGGGSGSGSGTGGTLGINNVQIEQIISPNPFNDMIKVSSDAEVRATLFSIDGKKIDSLIGTQITFDTNFIPKGYYIMEIEGNSKTYSKRIVKQ